MTIDDRIYSSYVNEIINLESLATEIRVLSITAMPDDSFDKERAKYLREKTKYLRDRLNKLFFDMCERKETTN